MLLLLLLLGVFAGTAYYYNQPQATPEGVLLYTVKKELLHVTVVEKGTLESADNRDLVCRVRAGSRGFATTINWVIDDGARVRPGQLLILLDDSALKEQEDNQSVVVKRALAAKVKAEKDYEIQIKKNESLIAEKQAAYILAQIELDKLIGLNVDPKRLPLAALASGPSTLVEGGAFQQQVDDLTGQISLARSEVEQYRERVYWAERMVKMSYMSPAQAQAERSKLDSAMEKLRSLEAQRKLLISHDRRQKITQLTSERDNARRALEQARLEAEALEIQYRTEMETTTSIYEQELEKLEDIRRQRRECRIHAPPDIQDGSMVVYFKNESRRFSSSTDGLIEQGAQVKEGQKLLRIPNLSVMQVNTKVHEAMVSRLRGEIRVPTRIVEFTQIGLLTNLNLLGRMVATRPEIAEELRQLLRQHEYRKIADGQRAYIRIDAMPDRQFVGYVRSVSAVASQADSWFSDVKVYQTNVRIEGELLPDGRVVPLQGEMLKPDMTAEVTIHVDASKEPVLVVPIQAIIGGAEMGGVREVFVKTANGYERRQVTLGLYNEKLVEIRSGLEEGEQVVINPRVLLGDSKTKTRETIESDNKKGGRKGDNATPGKSSAPGGIGPPKAAKTSGIGEATSGSDNGADSTKPSSSNTNVPVSRSGRPR
jgi:multidrug efflux pump subunit AcrA (membrane-fusion protein)